LRAAELICSLRFTFTDINDISQTKLTLVSLKTKKYFLDIDLKDMLPDVNIVFVISKIILTPGTCGITKYETDLLK